MGQSVVLDPEAFRPERQHETEPVSPSGAQLPEDLSEVEIPESGPYR
jgi:hypothetical protein